MINNEALQFNIPLVQRFHLQVTKMLKNLHFKTVTVKHMSTITKDIVAMERNKFYESVKGQNQQEKRTRSKTSFLSVMVHLQDTYTKSDQSVLY